MPEDNVDLKVSIAKVETRLDGHESVCAERYSDIRESVSGVNESVIATRREMRDGQAELRREIAVGQEKLKSEFQKSNNDMKTELLAKQAESSKEREKQMDKIAGMQAMIIRGIWTLAGTTILLLLGLIGYLVKVYILKDPS